MTNGDTLQIEISLHRDGKTSSVNFIYRRRIPNERPMALDVLLQAQATTMPELAFRFGCRARNCGVCTININGKPRIACRARVRDGDILSHMATLPVLADLVVRRDGIARQLRGRLQSGGRRNQLNLEAPKAYHDLTACIECYACLDNCPMHARNFNNDLPTNTHVHQLENDEGYRWGNPFSLLKLQRLRLDPMSNELGRAKAVEHAVELGLDACRNCPGCKCGVGIDLKGEVIKPLLKASSMSAGNQE